MASSMGRDAFILLVAAFGVRVLGVNYGATTMDEYIGQAVRILQGEFFPKDLFYPQVTSYLTALSIGVMFAGMRLLGLVYSVREFQELYFADPVPFYLAGRVGHAFISALVAPIAYLAVRNIGFERRSALFFASAAVLSPVSVWFAHWAKPQNGVAAGMAVALLFALLYLEQPIRRWAVGLGLAIGVGVAFMHSGIFPGASIAAGVLGGSIALRPERLRSTAQDAGLAAAVASATWVLLSIPLLVNLGEFVEYQVVQSQLSLREGGLSTVATHALPTMAQWAVGLGPIGLVAIVFAVALNPKTSVRWLGGTLVAGWLVVALIVGPRTEARLFMPFTVTLGLLAMFSFLDIARTRAGRARGAALVGAGLLLFGQTVGTTEVVRQALSSPGGVLLTHEILSAIDPETSRILVPDLGSVRLRQNRAAREEVHERHVRLGAKYGVEVPLRNPERLRFLNSQKGYHIREYPWILGGLEFTPPDEVNVVKVYNWPVQLEEWKLEHWLDRGYDTFVVWHKDSYLDRTQVPEFMVEFFSSIVQRCEAVAEIRRERDLFHDKDNTIYQNCTRLLADEGG